MDNPEPVRRVAPPSITMAKIMAQHSINQANTCLRAESSKCVG